MINIFYSRRSKYTCSNMAHLHSGATMSRTCFHKPIAEYYTMRRAKVSVRIKEHNLPHQNNNHLCDIMLDAIVSASGNVVTE